MANRDRIARKYPVLIGDILDKSARKRVGVRWWSEVLTTAPAALAAWLVFANSASEVAAMLRMPLPVARLLAITLALAASVFVIRGKEVEVVAGFPTLGTTGTPIYKYGQPVRHLSKVVALGSLLLLTTTIPDVLGAVVPLPRRFYGYLIDAKAGEPLADVRVRVVSEEGADYTDGEWLSDSEGFYRVETAKKPTRSAMLVVVVPGCKGEISLALSKEFEIRSERDASPIFRHVVSCGVNDE